jgi:hypothetical protein
MHKIVSQTGIDSLWIMLGLQLRLIHADQFFTFARILAKTVVSDSVKPCGKSRFTTKAPDVLVSANKSFLCQIVGQGNICACELPKQTAHARLVPPHQLAERVLIVIGKNSRDKVRISKLHGFNTMVLAEEEERSFCLPISIP